MDYAPYHQLDSRPSVIADGPPAPGTVITLSHWPHSPTPRALARDLSAQIVFAFLSSWRRWPRAELVSNDHVDQDGLVSVYALVNPEDALARRELLEDVAAAGDFATFKTRRAARISFSLATLADQDRSPLAAAPGPAYGYEESCGALYRELLAMFPHLLESPGSHRGLWEEEDSNLAASEAAFDSGQASLTEEPQADLAVVNVADGFAAPGLCTRFTHAVRSPLHPASIHNRTDRLRYVVAWGRRYRVIFRYESWVRLMSRKPPARVDLSPLAERLNNDERGDARWSFDAVGALEPVLSTGEGQESSLEPGRVIELLRAYLVTARPAWDPYAQA